MKMYIIKLSIYGFLISGIMNLHTDATGQPSQQAPAMKNVRERLLMDEGWRFAFGHATDAERDFRNGTGYFSYVTKAGYGDGSASKDFDDRSWRLLNLPHDWAVELPFDSNASYSHGYKIVGRNYPATSIGWYRKTFFIPESDEGKRVSIVFDGVHRNSIVWVNGFYLGEEHSGYYGFQFDITDYLKFGSDNVVAVRVDATMEEGWFYEGAGIYRHVWMVKTSPLHIAPDGIFISSKVNENIADLSVSTSITNDGFIEKKFKIFYSVYQPDGKEIVQWAMPQDKLKPGETEEYSSNNQLTNPQLWSTETPILYTLRTCVAIDDTVTDIVETKFGIRTLHFDADKGFFLNGKHLYLKGTNNHQDHAGVGTAIPDALQEFRIRRLKEMGSNAYRCSHNPPTPELLDACDRLGMLVIDENRLLGSTPEHLEVLKRLILRDRNHPSVLIWSIGNEEWGLEGNITGARIATTMQNFVQRLDPTRRVTYASSGWGQGISNVQDVMGFNYIFNGNIDAQHARIPHQPSIGTEETTSRATRGVYTNDTSRAHIAPTDRTPGGYSMEDGIKFYAARPFLSGLFFWTGFDHRGEPYPFGWPQVGSHCGIVDQCGFPKDMFYYLKSQWTEQPMVHITPHWNLPDRSERTPSEQAGWKGNEGQTINLWVYSNCEEVELIVNKKSQGKKSVLRYSHTAWDIPYESGTVVARGFIAGKEVIDTKIETTGAPAAIKLIPDRSIIHADGEDVSVITVQINDIKGRCVPTAEMMVSFALQGPGEIIGVGNGDQSSHEPDKFLEHNIQSEIKNLKAKEVKPASSYREVGLVFDDSDWMPMINGKGQYTPQLIDTTNVIVIRGTFTLPEFSEETVVSLWPKSLGETQTIYVNGNVVSAGIKRDDKVQQYKLANSILHVGKNCFAIVGSPLKKRFRWDELNTDPGIVQVVVPASPWKRKAFKGLAQVIVQSKKSAGEIILHATSDGLKKAVLKIQSQPSTLRPAVISK